MSAPAEPFFGPREIEAAERALEEPALGRGDLEITRDALNAALLAKDSAEMVETVAQVVRQLVPVHLGRDASGQQVTRQAAVVDRIATRYARRVLSALGLPTGEQGKQAAREVVNVRQPLADDLPGTECEGMTP